MAGKRSVRIDYYQLHHISSEILYETRPKKRLVNTYPKTFQVERIITRRTTKKGEEYLVKWEGWPLESSTWEPGCHLSTQLLRNYDNPVKPAKERLYEAGRQFFSGISNCLKGKSRAPVYVHLDGDIWRYVSHNKGRNSEHRGFKLYGKDDLCLFEELPNNWWYILDKNGEGCAIDFPIKIKPLLTWTHANFMLQNNRLTEGSKMPIEKLCIVIVKRPCNIHNLLKK